MMEYKNQEEKIDIIGNEDEVPFINPLKTHFFAEYATDMLSITYKTLCVIAESGEFEMGKISGKGIVEAKSFFQYLDRVHFKMKETDEEKEEFVLDSKGKYKPELARVKKHHVSIPKLKHIGDFAKILDIDNRTMIRNCDLGLFTHYRIGSLYKMSDADFDESCARITNIGMKTEKESTVGRPFEFHEKIKKADGDEE